MKQRSFRTYLSEDDYFKVQDFCKNTRQSMSYLSKKLMLQYIEKFGPIDRPTAEASRPPGLSQLFTDDEIAALQPETRAETDPPKSPSSDEGESVKRPRSKYSVR